MLERARKHGVIGDLNPEIATRMFFGPLLTYALINGLFRPEGQQQPPSTEEIEEIVTLYMKAIS